MKMQSVRARTHFARALTASTILAGMAVPNMAFARDDTSAAAAAAPAPDAAADPGSGLGDIIVTAARKSESVQKVPISMQALDMAKLDERQVMGLSDLAMLLPSVSFAGIGPGRNTAYFRGIVPAGGNYASVGYYLDDIPITGIEVPDIHVYDLERIEALAGPQGTLYGAGSLGGTIRFITNKPKLDKLEFGYETEANKYGKGGYGGQAEAYVNVPIGDSIAVRAMGFYQHDGGYIDNVPNNGLFNDGTPAVLNLGDNVPSTFQNLNNAGIAKNNYNPIYAYGGRLEALFEVAPGWQVTPSITAQRQIAYGYFGYDPRVGDLQVHDYDLTRHDDKFYQAALSIHGHIGDFDLVSATGYYARKIALRNDYSYYTVAYDKAGPGYENYLQFFDKSGCTGAGASLKCTTLVNPTQYFHSKDKRNKFTQELRLTTPKSWPFDLTLGGFYQRQKEENNEDYAIHGLDTVEGYTQAGGQESNPAGFGIPVDQGGTLVLGSPAVKGDTFYLVEDNQLFHDEAIFGEGHYNITPKLKLTGGLRYFWTDFSIKGFGGVASSAENTQSSLYIPTGTFGCPLPLPTARIQCTNQNPLASDGTGRYSEHGETHKIALDWQFAPSKMIYANYSTGFRPGGFNRPLAIRATGIVVAAPAYKSETLTNYEIGLKTSWHNIFRFNAAIYREDWNNIQYTVVVAGAQGAGYTGNAGKARVYGAEYDADLKLGQVTLSTSGAYNNAKLKGNFCNFQVDLASQAIIQFPNCKVGQFIPGTTDETNGADGVGTPQVAAASGTRLPRQPKFKGTTSIRYDSKVGDYDAFLEGAALYQTGATQDLSTSLDGLLGDTPGFASFDFSGGIKKDHWGVELFIENAFDRRGQLTRNTFCSIAVCAGSSRTFAIRPQFFGIKFTGKY